MSLIRVRWLTAVCLSLGLPPLCLAQAVGQTVARSAPPRVIATSAGPAAGAALTTPVVPAAPLAVLGRPVPAAAARAAVGDSPRGGTVFRAQAPDLDGGSPYPPAVPPAADAGSAGFAPYTTQAAGRYDTPAMQGVVIPAAEDAAPAAAAPAFTPFVTIGLPRAHATRTVSASAPGDGPPVDLPPPALGTAAPQPALPDVTPHSAANPPDSVVPPGAGGALPPSDIIPGVATDRPVAPSFWEKCRNWISVGDNGTSSGRCSFQSDHCFEGMVSPLTMPFFFEDPRSLTEVRPIFIYQSIPSKAPNFGGGDAFFFGTQARVAVTERLSVVMSELGFLSLSPKSPTPPVQNASGFSEIKIGPKYTFYRDAGTGTVAAAGLTFEFPVGDKKVFQDTGSLSLDPYVSFGQTFGRLPGGYGDFNFLSTFGYSLSTDNKRSEFFHSHLHLDYNVAKANTFYPLVELNWLHYTSRGTSTDLGTEGGDLINFGSSTRRGNDLITLAGGLRYRFNEHIQAGGAVEVPVSHERGLSDYRLTFDVIFRY